MTAIAFLQADPFLPAREAAIRWDLTRHDEAEDLDEEDLGRMWRNQANVCRPLFELIPDLIDCHGSMLYPCAVCGAT